jgi:hypothetical protein
MIPRTNSNSFSMCFWAIPSSTDVLELFFLSCQQMEVCSIFLLSSLTTRDSC